jgi:two-component system, response regulator PdtaR
MAKILIVEDEQVTAMDISDILRNIGHEITDTISTGEKALESVRDNRPDIIIMDINLKGKMDGIEAAERIRSQDRVPVVFLTAYYDETTVGRAKKSEPCAYLSKPFGEIDLKIAIELGVYRARIESEREALIKDLQKALSEVKFLQGFLPICSFCKKIRDDKGYWNQIESYISGHSEAEFSHGFCPECAKKHYPDFFDDNCRVTKE